MHAAKPNPIPVHYPESDGRPMAEDTLQFQWIVTIKENLDARLPDFVAGDLLWYPVEGEPTIRQAPDVMVALGRPKGHRGSYLQWKEGGVTPQVVFEILSPGNRLGENIRKFGFYQRYGVEEYYVYDPDRETLEGWTREGGELAEVAEMDGFVSPRLGMRFTHRGTLALFHADGAPFLTFAEVMARADEASRRADEASRRADEASRRADEASQRADEASQRADEETRRADALAERLRALGVEL